MSGVEATDEVIRGSALTKRFGALVALDRVEFSVRSGESVTVFGPNGAGKTTLIRVLTLGLRLDAGTLRVAGLDPRRDDLAIRGRIGVISHHSFLYDDLTASQNLEFYASLYGVADPAARARELLELMGLSHRANDRVGELSRGLQQRVSVARSLVHDPPLLFLDEPFTGLDPRGIELLGEWVRRRVGAGGSAVLTTHDLAAGLEAADRVAVLAGGRTVAERDAVSLSLSELQRFYDSATEAARA